MSPSNRKSPPKESQVQEGDLTKEPDVKLICFEDEGREPRNAGCLLNLSGK